MITRGERYLPGAGMMVFLAAAVLLLPWLGETLFNSKGEPREAIVAVSMLQSGNWLLPVSYGEIPYKPPFMAWLIAAIAWLFNGGVVTEYISRLPSALAAIAMVMAGYRWARRERDARFGLVFAVVTLTCVEVLRAAVACRLDMVLTACMVSAIYMLYDIDEYRGRFRWLRYAAVIVLLSCATMTKGPVGTLLPCLAVGVYRLLRGRNFFLTVLKLAAVALLSFVLPAVWYYAAWQQGGDGFYQLMYEENIGRLTGTMSYDSHLNPWYYNFMTLAAGLLPWTLLLLFCAVCRRRWSRSELSPAALMSIVAAAVTVLFYCIPASKRSVYLLPAYPFICYGIASLLVDRERWGGVVRVFTWVMSIVAILAIIAIIAIVAARLLPMAPMAWWQYGFVLLPLVAALSWILRRHSPAAHTLVIVWTLFLAYVSAMMPTVLNPNSNRPEALYMASVADGHDVLSLGRMRYYTLNYYLDNRMRAVESVAEASAAAPGTLLIFSADADTVGLGRYYDSSLLCRRGSDYRRPVYVAVKR